MRNIVIILLLLFLTSCKSTDYVHIKEETSVTYIDSTIIHRDTMYYQLPVEVYKDYANLLDTLKMETSIAKSEAWLDTTTMMLNGMMENKNVPVEIVYQYVDRYIARDSIVYKDKPVYIDDSKYNDKYYHSIRLLGLVGLVLLIMIVIIIKRK